VPHLPRPAARCGLIVCGRRIGRRQCDRARRPVSRPLSRPRRSDFALDGVGPDELHLDRLLARLQNGSEVREVIVATNPSMEGEATATYLQQILKPSGVRVTRIARGLPVGGDLEYADAVTIAQALAARRDMSETD